MKFLNSYSDCFSVARVALRENLALSYDKAEFFAKHGVFSLDLVCAYADMLTSFNEISDLPFFCKFKSFENYVA